MTGEHPSALTNLVTSRGLAAEPVATETLLHLLRYSEGARAALGDLVKEVATDVPGGLLWSKEVRGDGDIARPDLIGADPLGARLILEAKFDAPLTPAQLDRTYLDRLQAGRPGLLLWIAPASRLPSLWPQLLAGPAGQDRPAIDPDHQQCQVLSHEIGDGRVLALATWETLLRRLGRGISEPAQRGDFEQLQDLVRRQLRRDWVPLRPGQLEAVTPQQLSGLMGMLVEAPWSDHADVRRHEARTGGYARNITSVSGSQVWVGLLLEMWAEHGVSPIWLWCGQKENELSSEAISDALEPLRRTTGLWRWQRRDWTAPVLISAGAERSQVTSEIVAAVMNAVRLLDEYRGTPPGQVAVYVDDALPPPAPAEP